MTWMKPPETTPQRIPSLLRVRIVVRAPGVRTMLAATSSRTVAGSPASVATRSCSDWAKSSSPRMARSVTARTSSSLPACAASISMTSPCTSVESTSKTTSRLERRLRPAPSTEMSTPCASERGASVSRSRASSAASRRAVDTWSSIPVTG